MHQTFPQMYLTVSIGQSHTWRDPRHGHGGIIWKEILLSMGDGQLIFPHLNLPPLILQNKSKRHTNLVVDSKFPQHQPSSIRVKSPKQDLLITTSKISYCLLQFQSINRTTISPTMMGYRTPGITDCHLYTRQTGQDV